MKREDFALLTILFGGVGIAVATSDKYMLSILSLVVAVTCLLIAIILPRR